MIVHLCSRLCTTTCMVMERRVTALLSEYPELEYWRDTGKVRCSLSGHEMPCCLEVLQSYVGGRKFARLRSLASLDCTSLEPFIIPSTQKKDMLFCAVTNRYINRKPDEVKGHMSGKKYKKALEQYNAGELKLFEEKKRSDNGDHTSGSVLGGDKVSPWVSEDGRMELGDDTGGSENGETEATQHVKVSDHRRKHKLKGVPTPAAKKAKTKKTRPGSLNSKTEKIDEVKHYIVDSVNTCQFNQQFALNV